MGNLHKGVVPEERWDVEDIVQPQELVASPVAMRNSHPWPPELMYRPWPRSVLGHEDQTLLSVPPELGLLELEEGSEAASSTKSRGFRGAGGAMARGASSITSGRTRSFMPGMMTFPNAPKEYLYGRPCSASTTVDPLATFSQYWTSTLQVLYHKRSYRC